MTNLGVKSRINRLQTQWRRITLEHPHLRIIPVLIYTFICIMTGYLLGVARLLTYL